MYQLMRQLLFCLDPETGHDLALGLIGRVSANPKLTSLTQQLIGSRVPELPTNVMGIRFPNPVGLAAGLDKQGNCTNGIRALGFGWTELGTVTPEPQPGNDKPRMFRLASHNAIINRMGFNSIGLAAFLDNVFRSQADVIKGINIGKNASTPVEQAAVDYLTCLRAVYAHADYIAINISSPNTSNLRTLQNGNALDQLLSEISLERDRLAQQQGRQVPLVLKIAPDLTAGQVEAIARLLIHYKMDGVAATNTTISRQTVSGHKHAAETGGLSGWPVTAASTRVIAALHDHLRGEIPIIGVGGIDSADKAMQKIDAGASLVQIYTGFIYQGPALVKHIVRALSAAADGQPFEQYVVNQHRQKLLADAAIRGAISGV